MKPSSLIPRLLFISGIMALTSVKAEEGTVNFTAKIIAVCALEVPSLVEFGEIPVTAFNGKTVGTNLSDYTEDLVVKTNCSGTSEYTLTFTPSSIAGTCVGTNNTAMRVCIKMPDNTALDFTSGKATYTGTSSSETLNMTAYPQVGATTVSTGDVTASVTVMIEPA